MNRLEEIIEIVKNNEKTNIDYLADYFKVTTMTIYNDLKKLGNKIIVSKSDVIYFESEDSYFSKQPHYFRLQRHKEEKKEIAKKAINYIEDTDTVFLDGSSTAHYLAKEITNKKFLHLTIITYSPVIVLELTKNANIEIICLGGKFNRNNYIFFNNSEELMSKQINITRAFISAIGISEEAGFTELEEEESRLKNVLPKYCKEIFILADRSKFGVIGTYTFGPITYAKKIITDNGNIKIELLDSIKNEVVIE